MTDIIVPDIINNDALSIADSEDCGESELVQQYFDKYSESDDTFSRSTAAGGGKKRNQFAPQDPLHFQIKRAVNLYDDNGRKRSLTTEFYATRNIPGTRIRNAATGNTERHRCGSIYENLYYKVCHATGEFGNKDPLILFYDTPEQYERHWNVRLSQENKDQWQVKYVEAQRRFLNDKE